MRVSPALLAALVLLTGCGEDPKRPDRRLDRDPEVAAALNDPIMADPDLVSQNRDNSVLQGGGPPSAAIPPDRIGREEVEAARAEALRQIGGRFAALPPERPARPQSPLAGQLTARAIAQALPQLSAGCLQGFAYGFSHAARMPAALPLYPRSHARQAAGSDSTACRLRVVAYVTPAPPLDVLSFHTTTAAKAGAAMTYAEDGSDKVIEGKAKGLAFAVVVRPPAAGLTEVVLVTAEK